MNKKDNYLLKCPLCLKKMWLKGSEDHRAAKHPDISKKSFERLIIEALKNGNISAKKFEEPNKSLASARVGDAGKYTKDVRVSTVSGGKMK